MVSSRLLTLAIIAILTMSLVPVLVKSNAANETTIAIARLVIASVVFFPLAFLREKPMTLSRKAWLQLFIIGLFFAVHWMTYFISIKMSSASLGALALSTYGAQYVILAWLFNGERIDWIEAISIIICFAGCLVVAPEISLSNKVSQGVFIGLLSALIYAFLPLLHQRASSTGTLTRTFGQFFFALLIILPFFSFSNWDLSTTDYWGLLILGLLCTVIAHGLWVKASTELPAIYTGMIYYLYVPIAMLSSTLILNEELGMEKIIGAIMIIGASTSLTVYRFCKPNNSSD